MTVLLNHLVNSLNKLHNVIKMTNKDTGKGRKKERYQK